MCGIAGIYHYQGDRRVDPDRLASMTDILAHRGPDDSGLYVSGPIGLGHRRLSIVDLSPAGRNPMPNEDETLWVTLNGEIYNVIDRRAEFEARGHRFRSHTDTEMLLHLYEEKGTAFVDDLRGMFGIALWDAPHKTLVVVRDRDEFIEAIRDLMYDPGRRRALGAAARRYTLARHAPGAVAHVLEGVLGLATPTSATQTT